MVLNGQRLTFSEASLKNAAIEDTTGAAGLHIPEGMLLVYDTEKQASETMRTKIVTTEVAPMILSRIGTQGADYLQKPPSSMI